MATCIDFVIATLNYSTNDDGAVYNVSKDVPRLILPASHPSHCMFRDSEPVATVASRYRRWSFNIRCTGIPVAGSPLRGEEDRLKIVSGKPLKTRETFPRFMVKFQISNHGDFWQWNNWKGQTPRARRMENISRFERIIVEEIICCLRQNISIRNVKEMQGIGRDL